jgi:hypothetical protein
MTNWNTIGMDLWQRFQLLFIACWASVAVGCGGIDLNVVDPDAAGAAAIEQYDKDGDGLLDKTELKACPALLKKLDLYDESGDEKLTGEEIRNKIQEMYDKGSGMTQLSCIVTMDGMPLSGATVKFIPEPFLGSKIPPAQGVTASSGDASISIAPEELPKPLRRHSMMRAGIYRVEITHPTKKIPARYNTETELGFEFHNQGHLEGAQFHLSSKKTKDGSST